jgi:TonB family protein
LLNLSVGYAAKERVMNIVTLRTIALILSALVTAPTLVSAARADSDAQTECRVGVLAAPAEFPLDSQRNAEHGTVRVLLRVDAQGRAVSAVTEQSSGYARLDRAALHSVMSEWRFNVSTCAGAKFPLTKQVEVEYRRAPIATLSGSVSSKHSAALADARSNPSCFTHFDSNEHNGDFSVACVAHPKNSLQSLAQGEEKSRP